MRILRYAHDAYASTVKRAPRQPLIRVEHTLSEITGPRFGREIIRPGDIDLTHFNGGEAIGERIIVSGRILDEDGRPDSRHPHRDLAGQRGRPLCASGGSP